MIYIYIPKNKHTPFWDASNILYCSFHLGPPQSTVEW